MDLISEFNDGYRYMGIWSSPPGYGQQYPVKRKERIVKLLNKYNGVFNCGISMCSIINDVPHLLYLPFDFDSKDLKKAWEDASKLYNFCIDSGYDVTINFSGYRGFHVILSVIPKPYSRPQIRVAQKFFMDALNLKTCDKAIFGDIRRLLRIPGSIHCGKYEKTNSHWERIGNGGLCDTISHSPGELLDIDELVADSNYDFDYERKLEISNTIHDYPCLEKHMRNEEPPHIIRYNYVAMLLKKGLNVDEIFEHLKENYGIGAEYEWNDWDDYRTRKQIRHIAYGSNYNPMNCSTLRDLGYCIKDCPLNIDDWGLKKAKDLR